MNDKEYDYTRRSIEKFYSKVHIKDNNDLNIPLKEQIFTGDLHQYYKYKKFPQLFFFHIFLTIMTTIQVNSSLKLIGSLQYR